MFVARLDAFEPRPALWRRWQRAEPILTAADLRSLRNELLDRQTSPDRKDALLAALIRRGTSGQCGDARLAAIVCLLPGARSLARQLSAYMGSDDAMAEVVAALWVALRRFDVERCHDRIAFRLLATARRQLWARAAREQVWCERTTRVVNFDAMEDSHVIIGQSAASEAIAAGVISQCDAALIDATRVAGLPLGDVGTLLGMSYEAAKKRRQRAEAAWLAWRAPARRPLFQPRARDAA